MGHSALTMAVARRGYDAAEQLGDPALRGFTSMSRAGVLIGVEPERGPDAAERIAPTRIRNDPIALDLVLTLDRRARRRTWELNSLRNRFGIGSHNSQNVNN